MKRSRVEVPCNGCTLCCRGDLVRLQREDPAGHYRTEPHPFIPGALVLAHKQNGECVYLDADRCTIHDRAPSLCRSADCRRLALKYDYETAMRLHALRMIDIRVWDRGRILIEQHRSR